MRQKRGGGCRPPPLLPGFSGIGMRRDRRRGFMLPGETRLSSEESSRNEGSLTSLTAGYTEARQQRMRSSPHAGIVVSSAGLPYFWAIVGMTSRLPPSLDWTSCLSRRGQSSKDGRTTRGSMGIGLYGLCRTFLTAAADPDSTELDS